MFKLEEVTRWGHYEPYLSVSDLVHTPVHRSAASSKFTAHTLHSSLSMLPNDDWAAMHDRPAPQVS